jgi:hypothetical protein
MAQVARFAMSTPSRHPAEQNAYDGGHHRYRPEYVSPDSWELNLMAFPDGLGEDDNGRPIIPTEISSFVWTVREVNGPFSKAVTVDRSPFMLREVFQLPNPGTYDVTLRMNIAGAEFVENTRHVRLRDFLVVSIGDSFASGEGNPDIAAVPSERQQAMCEATTLKLFADTFEKDVGKWLNALSPVQAIESVPYVGAIAAAGITEVNEVLGVVNRFQDLKDSAVEFIESAVVEGVEEVAGWLGIGDGGESVRSSSDVGWQEPAAHRSYRSGHSLAAKQVERNAAFGFDRVTFMSFARSGSTIKDGLLGPRLDSIPLHGRVSLDHWAGNRGQVEEAADALAGRRIDALIISVGLNDLGFSGLVTDSILWPGIGDRQARIDRAFHKLDNGELKDDFASLASTIRNELHPRRVLLTEYPVRVFRELQDPNNKPCGVLGGKSGLDLNSGEADELGTLGARLNVQLREIAAAQGWPLVTGIEAGFDKHGYCAKDPYYVSAQESCEHQGDFDGMLHPNAKGNAVTRDCIARALHTEMITPRTVWLEPVLHAMMA